MIKFNNITLYTIEEAAEILPVCHQTIRRYLKNGRLRGQKIGGRWLINEESINELLASPVVSSNTGDEVKQ